ncbi:MAG TPA: hypothetical protein VK154_02835 [Chitinophagales bacterium]|nr:hypothetical protein [Chitinophagales bacterium]
MKSICIALFLTFVFVKACFSQQVKVIALKVNGVDSSRGFTWQYEFYYPYIVCSNNAVQDSLNEALLSNISPDSIGGLDTNSIKHYLTLAGKENYTGILYNEIFASPKLLGIDIWASATAAYPHSWLTHYVFNTITGHRYELREIIVSNKQNEFAAQLMVDMNDSMNNHVIEIIKEVKTGYRDSSELDDLNYFMDECLQGLDTDRILDCDFYFQNGTLVLESICSFPHVAKALQPFFQIPYPAKSIREFLVPEIYEQLISEKGKK